MPLDPGVKTLVEQIEAGGLRLEEMSPVQAREAFDAMGAFDGEIVDVADVSDREIAGPGGPLRVRVYRPNDRSGIPVALYFHGGGWVIGNIDTHDNTCRRLAKSSGCVVVSVDYRLAPENPFPAAPEDCYAALSWVADSADTLRVDAKRIAVAGDSAGGNLAAAVSLMARDRGEPKVAFQLLIYPATDLGCDTASMRENAEGYFLTTAAMRWFWQNYVGADAERTPYNSPLSAESHADLPTAYIITAEYDPLRDEGELYGDKLMESGVPVRTRRYDGMIHGFASMAGVVPTGSEAINDAGASMRIFFGRG